MMDTFSLKPSFGVGQKAELARLRMIHPDDDIVRNSYVHMTADLFPFVKEFLSVGCTNSLASDAGAGAREAISYLLRYPLIEKYRIVVAHHPVNNELLANACEILWR